MQKKIINLEILNGKVYDVDRTLARFEIDPVFVFLHIKSLSSKYDKIYVYISFKESDLQVFSRLVRNLNVIDNVFVFHRLYR